MERQKKISKLIDRYFSKLQNLPPPESAVQKKLFPDEDFEEEKKIAEKQKQKEIGKKRENIDAKLLQKNKRT